MKQHKLLDPIRERPEFKEILGSLEKTIEAENLAKRESKDDNQKLADQQQAAKLLRELAEKEPAEVRHQATLAASLRSIGLIQLGQKNYAEAEKTLNEALGIGQSLKDKLPSDPSQQAGHAAVRMALGRVWWETDRRPEAHRVWQECLSALDHLERAHPSDTALQDAMADVEREVCGRYGQLGLWQLAAEYALRNVRLRRITDLTTDSYFSVLLLALQKTAEFGEFCRQYDEYHGKSLPSGPWIDWHKSSLVWHSSLAEHPSVPVERLVEIGRMLRPDPQQNHRWFTFSLAMALYRHRQHAEALEILLKNSWGSGDSSAGNDGNLWVCSAYLRAMLHHALQQPEAANRAFAAAEAHHRRFCQDTLHSDDVQFPPPVRQFFWWLIYAQQLRGEARRTLHGEEASDPWQRLIQARGYLLIGEKEKVEAELAATDAPATKDAELCLARARLFERLGNIQRAEAEWQRVVDQAGKDPMPWIHRGRWYAERGQHEKADADFAKAAPLTQTLPEGRGQGEGLELNKFLEAGWWVVGPYPSRLDEFCPPELDPDPSKPVHIIDPTTGLSEEPVKWRRAATGDQGRLDVSDFPDHKENSSVYALAYAYSPDERTLLLRIGGANGIRVWCNGRLLLDADGALFAGVSAERIPVALRRGRNQILLRAHPASPFRLRLGDTPLDRALSLAEHGLWHGG